MLSGIIAIFYKFSIIFSLIVISIVYLFCGHKQQNLVQISYNNLTSTNWKFSTSKNYKDSELNEWNEIEFIDNNLHGNGENGIPKLM